MDKPKKYVIADIPMTIKNILSINNSWERMLATSLNQVLKGSDMSVGDFVRSTKQLIDLLGQIANASPELNKKCREAVKSIDRGVVTYLLEEV
jgi:superfamily II RNA helicase